MNEDHAERRKGYEDLLHRTDPEHMQLLEDVRRLKETVDRLAPQANRIERYIVGGWNSEGTEWMIGLRELVKDRFDTQDKAMSERFEKQDDKMEKLNNRQRAIRAALVAAGAGIWAIALLVIAETLRQAHLLHF